MSEKTVKPAKNRLKPNVIDFLIILVIIGIVVSMALRTGVVEQVVPTAKKLETAEVSFLIQDINDNSGAYFQIGDEFYSPAMVMDMGTLTSVQIMPAEAFITDLEGNLIKTYSNNGRIDVRGTMECEGTFSDAGFLLGGTMYIAPGGTVQIQSPGIDVTMMITDIREVESDPDDTKADLKKDTKRK